jgi:hypothetical protein
MRLTFILLAFLLAQVPFLSAQNSTDSTEYVPDKIYVVTKNDGTEFIGKILSQDAREILMETEKLGQVIIPKHEIKSILEVKSGELDRMGRYVAEEVFSTRYFVTTNGLPMKRGDSYMIFNLYGPDFQVGLTDHFSLGFMSTWIGAPFAVTGKYSTSLGKKVHLGIGGILGTMSWAASDQALAVPFVSITQGDSRSNISLSTGYGAFFGDSNASGRFLFSIGGMTSMGNKFSAIFDSVILPEIRDISKSFSFFMPGIRIHTGMDKAFQFGLALVVVDAEIVPIPFPLVQWYRKFN